MKIAVLGYGTIGSGVVEILDEKRELIKSAVGEEVEVKYVLDLREFPDSPIADKLVHDFEIIKNDPEISLVVELMGGTGAAYQFVKAALLEGKSACTSNKALVAKYGSELLTIARESNLNFQFEASVGGGIPIIRPLYSCMTAGNIEEITGILNGTTNFILSKMEEGRSYEDVLKEAQALGYAERDPSADVEGFDTCRKIAILASIAFGGFLDFEEIETRGICEITKSDMAFAKKLGMAIKLLGTCKKEDGKLYAGVSPALLKQGHPLYPIRDVYNGILVRSDMAGELMFYGSGAGKLPTASAVVADIIEIAKNTGHTVYKGWPDEQLKLTENADKKSRYFVRFSEKTQQLTDTAARIFGAEEITSVEGEEGFALITAQMKRAEYEEKAAGFEVIAQVLPVVE